jgi:hypothetical protein
MGPLVVCGFKSSPCPPFALIPCSKVPCSHGSVFPLPQGSVFPWFRAPMYIYTLHPCYHAPMHHATLLPCTVDAWVISHRHHDTMTHTHPCRSTTGLTATLTPVIHQPTSPISLPTPHRGSLLPFKPLYHRNHGNTHPMHPKPLNPSYQTGEKSLPPTSLRKLVSYAPSLLACRQTCDSR